MSLDRVYAAFGQAPAAARDFAINAGKSTFAFLAGHKVAVAVTAAAIAAGVAAKRYLPDSKPVKAGDAVCSAVYAQYKSVRNWIILHIPNRTTSKVDVIFEGFSGSIGRELKKAFAEAASIEKTLTVVEQKEGSGKKILLATSKHDQEAKKNANPGAIVFNLGLAQSNRWMITDYTIGWLIKASNDYSAVIADAIAQV